MYFSGMKIDPKYTFLHVFFLIVHYVLSKICQYDQKHILFSNFTRFCTPKRCMRVHCQAGKTTLITWFFYEDDIQLQIQVAPLGTLHVQVLLLGLEVDHANWSLSGWPNSKQKDQLHYSITSMQSQLSGWVPRTFASLSALPWEIFSQRAAAAKK